jgi:hypothetical protein
LLLTVCVIVEHQLLSAPDHHSSVATGFIASVVIAVVVALLEQLDFAPGSGEALRRRVWEVGSTRR